MKVGYLGPPGSFSHEAALQWRTMAACTIEMVALADFAAVLEGVESGLLDEGVLPVENSTQGAVASAMDLLERLDQAGAVGEVVLDVEHCLLTPAGEEGRIERIYSHEQAIAQCRGYLSASHRDARLIPCESTSRACELAVRDGSRAGAIANRTAAALYGLRVVSPAIQDNVFNQTRFLVLGRYQPAPTGADKTSVTFTFAQDGPGRLYSVMRSFAERDINLTRVESRPARQLMGRYVFHMDFIGHREELSVYAALQEAGAQTERLRVIGSYPMQTITR